MDFPRNLICQYWHCYRKFCQYQHFHLFLSSSPSGAPAYHDFIQTWKNYPQSNVSSKVVCILRKISLSKTNPSLNKRKHPNPSPISKIKTSLFIALNPNPVIYMILIPIPAIVIHMDLKLNERIPGLYFWSRRSWDQWPYLTLRPTIWHPCLPSTCVIQRNINFSGVNTKFEVLSTALI